MASVDDDAASHSAGILVRRLGGVANIHDPYTVSPRGIMACDPGWRCCSSAVDRRVRAGAVRALEKKRPRGGNRFWVPDH